MHEGQPQVHKAVWYRCGDGELLLPHGYGTLLNLKTAFQKKIETPRRVPKTLKLRGIVGISVIQNMQDHLSSAMGLSLSAVFCSSCQIPNCKMKHSQHQPIHGRMFEASLPQLYKLCGIGGIRRPKKYVQYELIMQIHQKYYNITYIYSIYIKSYLHVPYLSR